MQKQLRKPANWQDFESLCKKLWGEIWQVSAEIKKNGRSGQAQAGVDVYAVPKGEAAYWGIQCKRKDDYADARLTRKEVDDEWAKAQRFQSPLAVSCLFVPLRQGGAAQAVPNSAPEKLKNPACYAQTGFKVEMQGFEPWSRQGNQRAFYVRIQT